MARSRTLSVNAIRASGPRMMTTRQQKQRRDHPTILYALRCYVHTIRTQSPDGRPGTVVAGLRRWTRWAEMTDLKASVGHDDALDDKLYDGLVGASRRQMKPDHRLQLDHACGDLDQAKAQGVDLRHAPRRAFGHQRAQAPQCAIFRA